MSKPVLELRAIKYHLDQNPELRVQLSLAHQIRFKNLLTGETIDRQTTWLVNAYQQREKAKADRTKKLKKELRNGHSPEPNPVRPSRRVTQTAITGDGDNGTQTPADDRPG